MSFLSDLTIPYFIKNATVLTRPGKKYIFIHIKFNALRFTFAKQYRGENWHFDFQTVYLKNYPTFFYI